MLAVRSEPIGSCEYQLLFSYSHPQKEPPLMSGLRARWQKYTNQGNLLRRQPCVLCSSHFLTFLKSCTTSMAPHAAPDIFPEKQPLTLATVEYHSRRTTHCAALLTVPTAYIPAVLVPNPSNSSKLAPECSSSWSEFLENPWFDAVVDEEAIGLGRRSWTTAGSTSCAPLAMAS